MICPCGNPLKTGHKYCSTKCYNIGKTTDPTIILPYYDKGMADTEIAQALAIHPQRVGTLRRRLGLVANKWQPLVDKKRPSVSMSVALPPDKLPRMQLFLQTVLKLNTECQRDGRKPDVGKLMSYCHENDWWAGVRVDG